MKDSPAWQIFYSTYPTLEAAETAAQILVEARLAPCVQILPVTSHYLWQDKLEKQTEFRLEAKIRSETFERVCQLLVPGHPYQVPEMLAVECGPIAEKYRQWLEDVSSGTP